MEQWSTVAEYLGRHTAVQVLEVIWGYVVTMVVDPNSVICHIPLLYLLTIANAKGKCREWRRRGEHSACVFAPELPIHKFEETGWI